MGGFIGMWAKLFFVHRFVVFFGQSALAHPTINEIDNDFGKIFTRIADRRGELVLFID